MLMKELLVKLKVVRKGKTNRLLEVIPQHGITSSDAMKCYAID